jgi:NAD(P)-dependent dehydrogenase (short-subunit alcohol dehydrogenase family)
MKNRVAIVTGATGSIGAAVCGNLLVMLQGGTLDHDDTAKNMRLFSREVLPHTHRTSG